MALGREMLRREAKKVYKENTKNIPKRNRIPFAQFFKQFMKMRNTDQTPEIEVPDTNPEDFDFENFINVNQIDDESLEDGETIEVVEDEEVKEED